MNEIQLQGMAMLECKCPDTLAMIERHAGTFRSIIEGFKEHFDRLPDVDELLWCASEIAKHNIRTEE